MAARSAKCASETIFMAGGREVGDVVSEKLNALRQKHCYRRNRDAGLRLAAVGSSVEVLQQYTQTRLAVLLPPPSRASGQRVVEVRRYARNVHHRSRIRNSQTQASSTATINFSQPSDRPTRTSEINSRLPRFCRDAPPSSSAWAHLTDLRALSIPPQFVRWWVGFPRVVPAVVRDGETPRFRAVSSYRGERIRRRSDSSIYTGMSPLPRLFDAADRLMDTTGSNGIKIATVARAHRSSNLTTLHQTLRSVPGKEPVARWDCQSKVASAGCQFIRFARSCNSRQ